MARLSYSGVAITGGTGRLNSGFGGSVLLKNGVVRNYVTPANPQTPDQQVNRTAFAFLTQFWKNLSAAQRDAWVAAWNSGNWQKQDPFTGTTRNYGSAKDLFISLNMNFLIADGSVSAPDANLLTPPATTALPALGLTSVTIDASAGTVGIVYTGTLTGTTLVIRMTPPVSPGNERTTSVLTKFRFVQIASGASPVAAGTAYVALFGAITAQAGQKVFYTVEAILLATGKRGLVGSGNTVIVA